MYRKRITSARRAFLVLLTLSIWSFCFVEALEAQATLRNHWSFDGSIDDDEGGSNATGEEPPFVTGFDCFSESAASFNGSQTLQFDNGQDDIQNQLPIDFSISAWVRLLENGPSGANFFQGAGIYFGEVTGFTTDAGFVIIDDRAAFGIGGGSDDVTIIGSTGITDGQWHHLVAIRDTGAGEPGSSTLSVYVDGVLDGQNTTDYDGPVSAPPFFVMGNNLKGDVDDLRIYDGVLTAQQLSDLANGGSAPTTFVRTLSSPRLSPDGSLTVAVTVRNTVASGGPVTITESISGLALSISSQDAFGVVVDSENDNTVSLTFGFDSTQSYTLTAGPEGCGPGSVTLSGAVSGGCVVRPADTSFECPGDLVSHYPFDGDLDDVAGGLAGLTTPVGPDPVYVDGVRAFSGEPGDQALRFDGSYGVDIQNVSSNNFTISCWVRMDERQSSFFPPGEVWWQGTAVMQGEVPGVVDDAGLTMVNNVALFGIGGPDQTVKGTTSLDDGQWHLLTATRSIADIDSEIKLYVDGEIEGQFTSSNTRPVDAHGVWGVGRQAQNRGLRGDMDDVRIYGRALSDAEIHTLFTGCEASASFVRGLSSEKLAGGDSTVVTVTATDVAVSGGSLTLTETVPDALIASSSDDGVTVDGTQVTIVFDEDGAKNYTLHASDEGCAPGSLSISGTIDGGCAIRPANTSLICLGDLVLHLPFDGTLEDEVSDRDGTLSGIGGPTYVEGVRSGDDQALAFDNDYGVDVQNIAPDDFTISCWVRMNGPQAAPCCGGAAFWMGQALFQGETTGEVDDSALTVLTDIASFGIGDPDTTIKGSTKLDDGEWHIVTATRFINTDTNLSELNLYVDGGLDASNVALNTGSLTANAVWGIGRQAQSRGLVGEIDDVRIYARALSPEEVQDLYTGCEGDAVSLSRALSEAKLGGGGDSTVVTVTAADVAVAGGPVVLTDTIPGGLTPSSSDDGVDIDGDEVTITFTADGAKSYTLTADGGGCPIGSTINGTVIGNCTIRPSDTRIICLAGLVNHYPLDGSIEDAVGGGIPVVTGTGAVSYVAGVLDGGDQALRFNNDYGLDIPNQVPDDFTLSCLVRMTAPQAAPCCGGSAFWMGHALFQGETTGDVDDSALGILSDVASFGIGNPDTTLTGTTSLADGRWHLVTATRSISMVAGESTLTLYVDGEVELVRPTPNTGRLTSNAVWGLGRQAQNRGLVGEIDDVRIYGRALSQQEVQALVPTHEGEFFRRGDCDQSGKLDFNDAIFHLRFLFLGENEDTVNSCKDACDSDDSGADDFTDDINTLRFLFLGQGDIPVPGPMPDESHPCGGDPTEESPEELTCEAYSPAFACP